MVWRGEYCRIVAMLTVYQASENDDKLSRSERRMRKAPSKSKRDREMEYDGMMIERRREA